MEVHAHSHTDPAQGGTSRKKWTHYLWEFLMLFLAVFCGFVAENIREHTVENKRAAEYAKALIRDLAKDTIELNSVIRDQQIALASTDSIGVLIEKKYPDDLVPGSFYYFSNTSTIAPVVAWNKSTLVQLIQSGNLRYFHNQELVNKMSYYYTQADYITTLVENDRVKRDASITIRNRILNHSIFSRYATFYSDQWLQLPDSMMNKKMLLISSDKKLLNEFANSLESRKRALTLLIDSVYPAIKNQAKELINILKEKY